MAFLQKIREYTSARFPFWLIRILRFFGDVISWLIVFLRDLVADAISGFRGS